MPKSESVRNEETNCVNCGTTFGSREAMEQHAGDVHVEGRGADARRRGDRGTHNASGPNSEARIPDGPGAVRLGVAPSSVETNEPLDPPVSDLPRQIPSAGGRGGLRPGVGPSKKNPGKISIGAHGAPSRRRSLSPRAPLPSARGPKKLSSRVALGKAIKSRKGDESRLLPSVTRITRRKDDSPGVQSGPGKKRIEKRTQGKSAQPHIQPA